MLTYLTEGWFSPTSPKDLHAHILDGAVDSAGLLARAGVGPGTMLALRQLLLRLSPYQAGGPTHSIGEGTDAPEHHHLPPSHTLRLRALTEHVALATDHNPTLQGFAMDCLQATSDAGSWQALCDHLGHISLAMNTLTGLRTRGRSAQDSDAAAGNVALDQARGRGPSPSDLRS